MGGGSGMSRHHFQRKEISVSKLEDKGGKLLEHLWNIPIPFLSFFRDVLAMEIGQLESYTNAVEQMLVEQVQKISAEFQEQTAGKSEEEREALFDWYGGEVVSHTDAYPKILRNSLFVHSYSLLGRALLEVASHYRRTRHLELSPSDLRDSGIERARTYLKKVALVQFPETESWQNITSLQHIRNLIVHNEGELRKDHGKERQKIEGLAKKWKGDVAIKGGKIELSQKFIFHVLHTFNTFFNELFANLPEE
jgi:hypothetical protein